MISENSGKPNVMRTAPIRETSVRRREMIDQMEPNFIRKQIDPVPAEIAANDKALFCFPSLSALLVCLQRWTLNYRNTAFRSRKSTPGETVTKSSPMKNAAKIPTYRVWGMDGVVYGAVDLPGLIQWIKDERVTPDQWVFTEHDNRWLKTVDLPELQATLRSKPPGGDSGAVAVGKGGRSLGVKPEALRRMKCFAHMDDRQIESFVCHMELLHCQQFSHIVRSGELGDSMYLVLEGELRALAIVDGKEVTLGTITAGESFGEISLIDQGPRSADVVANKDSVLLKISSRAFAQLLREAPALPAPFLLALSRAVVGRVREITKRHVDSVSFIRAAKKAR